MKTDWLNPESWENEVAREEVVDTDAEALQTAYPFKQYSVTMSTSPGPTWNSFDVFPTEDKVYELQTNFEEERYSKFAGGVWHLACGLAREAAEMSEISVGCYTKAYSGWREIQ